MINREIIEGVKFRFTEKSILHKKHSIETDKNLLDLECLQERNGSFLYKSEKELLNSVLQNEEVKHFRQLRYLATKHGRTVLKLRFVLSNLNLV